MIPGKELSDHKFGEMEWPDPALHLEFGLVSELMSPSRLMFRPMIKNALLLNAYGA